MGHIFFTTPMVEGMPGLFTGNDVEGKHAQQTPCRVQHFACSPLVLVIGLKIPSQEFSAALVGAFLHLVSLIFFLPLYTLFFIRTTALTLSVHPIKKCCNGVEIKRSQSQLYKCAHVRLSY